MGKHDNHSTVNELARKENNKLCVGWEGSVVMRTTIVTTSDISRGWGSLKVTV